MTRKGVTRRQFVSTPGQDRPWRHDRLRDTCSAGLAAGAERHHGTSRWSDSVAWAPRNAELAKTENLVAFADVDFAFSESKVAEKLKDDQKRQAQRGSRSNRNSTRRPATGFPRDARQAEEHRRRGHRDSRSPSRRRREGGHGRAVGKTLSRSRSPYSVHEARVLRDLAPVIRRS